MLYINRKESARAELLRLMGDTLAAELMLDEVLDDIDNGAINADVAAARLGLVDAGNSRLVTLTDLIWEAA